MAEKEKSRSQIVREYLLSVKPSDRGPKAVVEALKAKGVTVSQQLVSQVKTTLKKKGSRKGGVSIATRRNKSNRAASSMESWIIAKNLLSSVGGDLAAAKKNLEIVSKLLS